MRRLPTLVALAMLAAVLAFAPSTAMAGCPQGFTQTDDGTYQVGVDCLKVAGGASTGYNCW
jgi:hypothetical protein